MKLTCIVCKKEITPGNRPTGEPNGVGFQMASGKTYNVCADRAPWDMKEKFFTKKCCLNCIYARTETGQTSRSKQGRGLPLQCERLLLTGETCLTKGNDGKVYDRRGEDPDNCLLKVRKDG